MNKRQLKNIKMDTSKMEKIHESDISVIIVKNDNSLAIWFSCIMESASIRWIGQRLCLRHTWTERWSRKCIQKKF